MCCCKQHAAERLVARSTTRQIGRYKKMESEDEVFPEYFFLFLEKKASSCYIVRSIYRSKTKMKIKTMLFDLSKDTKADSQVTVKIIAHITDQKKYHITFTPSQGVGGLCAKIDTKLGISHWHRSYSIGYFDLCFSLIHITDDNDLDEFLRVQKEEKSRVGEIYVFDIKRSEEVIQFHKNDSKERRIAIARTQMKS